MQEADEECNIVNLSSEEEVMYFCPFQPPTMTPSPVTTVTPPPPPLPKFAFSPTATSPPLPTSVRGKYDSTFPTLLSNASFDVPYEEIVEGDLQFLPVEREQ
ncbi:uncharacterized protein ARMOST_18579 [Armillaria ostoyae]|uniref:Uncharacterized protein n=1 Tax=Armillaria ostoyae TaxID=47428 RepID=A0A284S2A1_ARMOS|nr:uncharacterized protein ARMOST_18579 [Armillaria ostoyae]